MTDEQNLPTIQLTKTTLPIPIAKEDLEFRFNDDTRNMEATYGDLTFIDDNTLFRDREQNTQARLIRVQDAEKQIIGWTVVNESGVAGHPDNNHFQGDITSYGEARKIADKIVEYETKSNEHYQDLEQKQISSRISVKGNYTGIENYDGSQKDNLVVSANTDDLTLLLRLPNQDIRSSSEYYIDERNGHNLIVWMKQAYTTIQQEKMITLQELLL